MGNRAPCVQQRDFGVDGAESTAVGAGVGGDIGDPILPAKVDGKGGRSILLGGREKGGEGGSVGAGVVDGIEGRELLLIVRAERIPVAGIDGRGEGTEFFAGSSELHQINNSVGIAIKSADVDVGDIHEGGAGNGEGLDARSRRLESPDEGRCLVVAGNTDATHVRGAGPRLENEFEGESFALSLSEAGGIEEDLDGRDSAGLGELDVHPLGSHGARGPPTCFEIAVNDGLGRSLLAGRGGSNGGTRGEVDTVRAEDDGLLEQIRKNDVLLQLYVPGDTSSDALGVCT